MEKVGDSLYHVGLNGQGLEKLEQKVELMEKHWEEFSMEVALLNHFSDPKLLWFSSFRSCTTAVSWRLLKQDIGILQQMLSTSCQGLCRAEGKYEGPTT